MNNLKQEFFLDPDIIFLNHGSFGSTPGFVMDVYQRWQRQMERQPVQFLGRDLHGYLNETRSFLADYIGAENENMVLVPNATYGVNAVVRSIDFKPGDEILTSDHEYGACEKILEYVCRKTGAVTIKRHIPLPALSPEEIIEIIWQGISSRTRLIFLSHITSLTSQRLPVEEICRRSRARGILTLIDGAHAPGQIDLDLSTIDADFYTGNCHKWLMAPKGTGFLYAHSKSQSLVEPLIVSWGWQADGPFDIGSPYLNNFQWMGTKDYSAYLSIPAAINFQEQHEWSDVKQKCQVLLDQALTRLSELTGLPPLYSGERPKPVQMGTAELPPLQNHRELQSHLYDMHSIEIPCIEWNQRHFIRVSIQGYNTQEDVDALLIALQSLIPEHVS